MFWKLSRAALACLVVSCFGANAQDFPNRPITVLVGIAAGGVTDITARTYAATVAKNTGWRLAVENRTGAGGGVAAAAVQNAPPDGHTILVFAGSQHATVAAMNPGAFKPVTGFAPITLLFNTVVVFAIPADSQANTLAELFELGRKKPGGLSFATPGLGSPSHLLGVNVLRAGKAPTEVIHYRGGSALMADLIANRVDLGLPTFNSAGPFIADKKLKLVAIDTEERSPLVPNVPTLVELGFREQRVATWFALAAPAGTPPGVIAKLNEEFVKASRDPELQAKLTNAGTPTATSTPEQLGNLMQAEQVKIERVVKELDLKPQQ